jgi:hypothetical protein
MRASNDDAPSGFEAREMAALIVPLLEAHIEKFVTCPIARQVLTERHRNEVASITAAIATLMKANTDNSPPIGWQRFAYRTQRDMQLLVHDIFTGVRREVGRRNLRACDRAAGARGRGAVAP